MIGVKRAMGSMSEQYCAAVLILELGSGKHNIGKELLLAFTGNVGVDQSSPLVTCPTFLSGRGKCGRGGQPRV